MKKSLLFIFALLIVCYSSYCDQNSEAIAGGKTSSPRNIFLPMLSYDFFSFDNFSYHEPLGGLALIRFNPEAREDIFAASLSYSPQIVSEIPPEFPDLYHTVSLMLMRKQGRHMINGAFIAMTEKPVYGGTHSFMAMTSYSYDLIERPHFSMELGALLLVFDLGVRLNNGMPWMLWPLPALGFSLEYEWIEIGLNMTQGLSFTLGPDSPLSLKALASPAKLDAALWYRFFKDKNPAAETFALAAGVSSESARVTISDGYRYGVKYNALYGTLRLFRFVEISGGWIFNGRIEYKSMDWTAMFGSVSYPGGSKKSGGANDYFISVSLRLLP